MPTCSRSCKLSAGLGRSISCASPLPNALDSKRRSGGYVVKDATGMTLYEVVGVFFVLGRHAPVIGAAIFELDLALLDASFLYLKLG